MTDPNEGPGNRVLNSEEMDRAFGERRAWSRVVEVRLSEETIGALARYISEEHNGRIQEDEAIRRLLDDELIRMGLLSVKKD